MQLSLPQHKNHCSRNAFLLALLTAAAIFIPFMIWDKGYFFFFGDFNVQQIPFYKLAHEAVRKGDIFWNWYTDLGANFVGSYSFYLLGSPFFWLTLPFPTEFVPHLMAPLLILKHACAAFTASLYLKRFLRREGFVVLASLLYAFSGYAVYNIFFNHFHEAIIFFPLLLVGLEELMVNQRRGVFAIAVGINAFVNYWFFIGEVVFVLLYFAVRAFSPDWRMSIQKFLWTAFESVLGLLLSMVLFLPSVLAIMGNPRTGADELLQGWGAWLYWHNQLYPAIAGSAFFPPDLPSRPNLFPDRGAKWASLSAWLPMVSMCGVIAYVKSRADWLRRILIVSFIFAMVPILNSAFVLFNNSYYARWFYMPLLLMALASARALETPSLNLRSGMIITGTITLGTTLALALTPTEGEEGERIIGLTKYPERFAIVAATALLGLVVFALIWYFKRNKKSYVRILAAALCVISVGYAVPYIAMGKSHSDDTQFIRDVALDGRYQLELDDSQFARSDLYDSMDNLGMYWHLPNLQAFHSIVPASLMTFYPKVGVKRDVSSKPETKYYQLRSLLSTRWFFVKDDVENQEDLMPGWEAVSNQMGYNIYENLYWVPMGFTYDYYISETEFMEIPEENRAAALLRVLVLEDKSEQLHKDILDHMEQENLEFLDELDYYEDCNSRRENSAEEFTIDNRGFTSRIQLPRENLVFYSVPYDKGWQATVNGVPIEIEKVDLGFMAVRAPAGDNEIRFIYRTPGLFGGTLLSIGGLLILAVYLFLFARKGKTKKPLDRFDRRYMRLPNQESPQAPEAPFGDQDKEDPFSLQKLANDPEDAPLPEEIPSPDEPTPEVKGE